MPTDNPASGYGELIPADPVADYLAKVQRDLTDGAAYPRRVIEQHAPRLVAAVEAVLALCKDTDGDYLRAESELPVGVFQAALWNGLLGEEADRG